MSATSAQALPRVLVLGAYSTIGQDITQGLLDRVECTVLATGRSQGKLDRLCEKLRHPGVRFSLLDAEDATALKHACQDADVVVNCVGPYIMSGREIAETVVRAGRHYVDFAFEQFHYERLQALDALARAQGVALVTGAGNVVGLSSILCAHAAATLPEVESLVVCALDGQSEEHDDGFSSLMNGALEPALGNRDYLEGRYVVARMGADVRRRVFPEPYGATQLLSDPTIDSLILPGRYGVRTVRNYFGVGVQAPPGFFALMRLLDPYHHRIFYRMTAALVRRLMRGGEERMARAGIPVAQLLRVEATSAERELAIEIHSRGAVNCTSCLPVLISGMLSRREVEPRGLLTALDLVTPERLFRELESYRSRGQLDWTIDGPRPRVQPVAACPAA